MALYEFGPNDIFHNQIKTYPQYDFIIYDTKTYLNKRTQISGAFTDSVPMVPPGYVSLYEVNVDRPTGSMIYPFIVKDGSLTSFQTITATEFSTDFAYGDVMTGSYPLSSSISIEQYYNPADACPDRAHVNALRNTLNYYKYLSPHYAFSSSLGNKGSQSLTLVSIPSIFFGSSMKKGEVNLKFYLSGTLIGELQDERQNGELIQVGPSGSNGSGSVAGVALYNEGFCLLTGAWDLHSTHTENYNTSCSPGVLNPLSPSWMLWGSMADDIPSSSFGFTFKGTNKVPVVTMLAHAPRGELNNSNNPTFIASGQDGKLVPMTSSQIYRESDTIEIKNTVSSSFPDPTGSFAKQTFISKIALYDENKNLIGFAKLAKPVKKTENREFTFKMKLDF